MHEKRTYCEERRHDEAVAAAHQRARFNKALKPGAKPTKAKDVGKGKRYRETDDVLDPCKIFQRM